MTRSSQSLPIFAVIIFANAAFVAAGSLANAPTVFQSGNWSVLRTTDPMTDTATCTGIYKGEYNIQMSSDSLFVGVRGGLSGIRLRFDDEPAQEMRLATDIEKKVDSIVIAGSDFSKVMSSRRLRVEALTLVRGVANEDLDLAGIKEAKSNIEQGCPVTGAVQPKAPTASIGLCPAKVVERLRARGLTEKATSEVCKE